MNTIVVPQTNELNPFFKMITHKNKYFHIYNDKDK